MFTIVYLKVSKHEERVPDSNLCEFQDSFISGE